MIVFDEFQEIITLDKRFPNLMRAVFQAQPDVGHVYLGSKRHLLERIFNDRNEPFWRSAKQLEIGTIAPAVFAPFLRDRFAATGKGITDEGLDRLLEVTAGHPYGTQELAYFVWELMPAGGEASAPDVEEGVARVVRSEHNHFAQLWDDAPRAQRLVMLALADEPTRSVYAADYHERHDLPATPTLQTALAALDPEGDRRPGRRWRVPHHRAVPRRVAPARARPRLGVHLPRLGVAQADRPHVRSSSWRTTKSSPPESASWSAAKAA